MDNTLQHWGIKGMKWGVRRYQNYDGTYTKKGLARYKKAESDYDRKAAAANKTREAYKSGTATKEQYREAKRSVKGAKKDLENAYKSLNRDYHADEGKKLYQRGKTIGGNYVRSYFTQGAVVFGTAVANKIITSTFGHTAVTRIATRAIAAGGTAVNVMLAGKANIENRNLRAYYGHR